VVVLAVVALAFEVLAVAVLVVALLAVVVLEIALPRTKILSARHTGRLPSDQSCWNCSFWPSLEAVCWGVRSIATDSGGSCILSLTFARRHSMTTAREPKCTIVGGGRPAVFLPMRVA
jgi:hypothetical protein